MSYYTTKGRTNYFRVEPQHQNFFVILVKILGAEESYKRGRLDTGLTNITTSEVAETFTNQECLAEQHELTNSEVELLVERCAVTQVEGGHRLAINLISVARCISKDSTLIYTEIVDNSPVFLTGKAEAINNQGQSIAYITLEQIYDQVLRLTGSKPSQANG